MATLYLTHQYSVVRQEADYLVVQIPADRATGQPKRREEVPLIKIDDVVVMGNVTVTTPALHALLDAGASVSYLSRTGQFKGRLGRGFSKVGMLRVRQHAATADPAVRVEFARRFVVGKLTNMRTLLLRSNRKLQDPSIEDAAGAIRDAMRLAEIAGSVESLLGHEGGGTAAYFRVFGKLLHGDWQFEHRNRRPPPDPLNALLSFGYTILSSKLAGAVESVGLDPFVGFLHAHRYGRASLALDLAEEFRPVVADSVVLTLVNNRSIQDGDFVQELGSCRLTDEARKRFVVKFEERLNTEIAHPVFGYRCTYRRALELQARLIAKTLLGEIPAYRPFMVR